jgi:hypothetical protein
MKKELQPTELQWEKGKFPPPVQILEAALAKIQKDGSVMLRDEPEGQKVVCRPDAPVSLNSLAEIDYNQHLLRVAYAIYGRVINISLSLDFAH